MNFRHDLHVSPLYWAFQTAFYDWFIYWFSLNTLYCIQFVFPMHFISILYSIQFKLALLIKQGWTFPFYTAVWHIYLEYNQPIQDFCKFISFAWITRNCLMSIKQMFKYQAIDTHLAHYIISSNSSCELPVFLHRVEILNLYNPPKKLHFRYMYMYQESWAVANCHCMCKYSCVPLSLHTNKHQRKR